MGKTRDRKERRAEKLTEWADSRDAKADAAHAGAKAIADRIPLGQPILVGHHSEAHARRDQARIESAMTRTVEHSRKASEMRDKAANIERAAKAAIYDDDEDAVEKLRAKIARLEAARERIKAYNASCRRGEVGGLGDVSLLDDEQQQELATIARVCSYQLGKKGQMPGYVLSNLGGVINTARKRLAALEQPDPGRVLETRYDGECAVCGIAIPAGETVRYFKRTSTIEHLACYDARQENQP